MEIAEQLKGIIASDDAKSFLVSEEGKKLFSDNGINLLGSGEKDSYEQKIKDDEVKGYLAKQTSKMMEFAESKGLPKPNQDEKYYNWNQRIIEDQLNKINSNSDLEKKYNDLLASNGGIDEASKLEIAQLKELNASLSDNNNTIKTKAESDLINYKKESIINSSLLGKTFKKDIPEGLINLAKKDFANKIMGLNSKFEGDTLMFTNENGTPVYKSATDTSIKNINDFAEDILSDYLDKGRSGSGSGSKNRDGSSNSTHINLSEFSTREQANQAYDKIMTSKGLNSNSKEYRKGYDEIREHFN